MRPGVCREEHRAVRGHGPGSLHRARRPFGARGPLREPLDERPRGHGARRAWCGSRSRPRRTVLSSPSWTQVLAFRPELLERVFEPFFSTKERGSGLGLAICASIAQAHGARIRADEPRGRWRRLHRRLSRRRRRRRFRCRHEHDPGRHVRRRAAGASDGRARRPFRLHGLQRRRGSQDAAAHRDRRGRPRRRRHAARRRVVRRAGAGDRAVGAHRRHQRGGRGRRSGRLHAPGDVHPA